VRGAWIEFIAVQAHVEINCLNCIHLPKFGEARWRKWKGVSIVRWND